MQHKLKTRALLTTPLLIIIGGSFWYYQSFKSKPLRNVLVEDEKTPNMSYLPYFLKAGEKLKKYWEEGSYPELGNLIDSCSELHWDERLAGPDYLKCNPQLLQCYFSGQIPDGDKDFNISINNRSEVIALAPDYKAVKAYSRKKRFYRSLSGSSIEVSLFSKNNPSVKFLITLKKTCNEIYLPKESYSHSQKIFGVDEKSNDVDAVKVWENKEIIFVDKFLVSKHDIFEWKVFRSVLGLNKNIFEWTEYADNLTLNQMKDFCFDRGKQLLTSRVYDAASFFRDLERKEKMTSLFSWGDRNKGLVSPRADFDDHYDEDGRVHERTCDKIPTLECQRRFRSFGEDNVSWMGVHDIMGGPLEALDNQEAPHFNIKASSFYFNKFSPWHLLSHRFTWDGKGFGTKSFRFDSSLLGKKGEQIISDDIKVGFRCMRVIE